MKELKLCARCREHKTGHRDQVYARCEGSVILRIASKRKPPKRWHRSAEKFFSRTW